MGLSLEEQININIKTHLSLLKLNSEVNKTIKVIAKKIKNGGKLLLCGNGGSAADAQHLAAEFLVRLRPNVNRKAIPAISLAQDTSTLTACGNDYSFDDIFVRTLQAIGTKKDILVCISTSGNSKNILKVLKEAKKKIFTLLVFWVRGVVRQKRCVINLL